MRLAIFRPSVSFLLGLLLVLPGCGEDETATPPDAAAGSGGTGGISGSSGRGGSAGTTGSGGAADAGDGGFDADASDAAAPVFHARFANFDPDLPLFDVCALVRDGRGPLEVHPGLPFFAAQGVPATNVTVDEVSARVTVPLNAIELFLVPAGTTACSQGVRLPDTPFSPAFPAGESIGFQAGDRVSFVAAGPSFSAVGRTRGPETGEFRSCASGSTCVLFAPMVSYSPAPDSGDVGPRFTVDLIRDGARSSVSYAGSETVFGFGDVILPELSVAGASSVKLAIREQGTGADLVVVDLPEPSGKVFSLWLVGHPGASGAGAQRVILCRDSEPEIDGLSDCARIAIP